MTAIPNGPQLIAEVGFSGPGTGAYLHLDDAARGRLGTGTLAPVELWTDVSPWLVSAKTRRGATRAIGPTLRYESGAATLVLRNDDRRFDPTNLAGPYTAGGVTQVEPMRAVRLRATWDGVTYPLWQGYGDWRVSYDGPNSSLVTLVAADAFMVFAGEDRTALGSPVGGGELSGARINRILDAIGWAAGDRRVAAGDSTMQATTLSDDVLAELLLTADSESGEFYIDAQGHVVFRNRLALFEESRSTTVQATFGDDQTQPTELPYADATLTYDAASIYNRISLARKGGTAQVVEDTGSIQQYLARTHRRTDLLLETDAEVAQLGRYLLQQSATPELRVSELRLHPQGDGRVWQHALGREIGDRIRAIRRPPGGGVPIDREVYVRGVEHDVRADLSWTTTFVLQSATRGQFLVLDNPTLGRLDANSLAY